MNEAIRVFDLNFKEKVSGIWDENIPIVRHTVIECAGVKSEFFFNKNIINIFNEIMEELDLHKVSFHEHEFSPQGQSFVFILQESHLAVHCWPEKGYIHIDLVTCSKEKIVLLKVADVFSNFLSPISTRVINLVY